MAVKIKVFLSWPWHTALGRPHLLSLLPSLQLPVLPLLLLGECSLFSFFLGCGEDPTQLLSIDSYRFGGSTLFLEKDFGHSDMSPF